MSAQDAESTLAVANNVKPASPEQISRISCHGCRKRKVKCNRELPSCSICRQSSQRCSYPKRILKPGPKIGSTNTACKRKRAGNHESHRREFRGAQSITSEESIQKEHPQIPESGPTSSGVSSKSLRHSKDIQSLSFIIHPSHESCSPEERSCRPTSVGQMPGNETPLLIEACLAFGVVPEIMRAL